MNTNNNYKSVEQESAEKMHHNALKWISRLKFIKIEHTFLNTLLEKHFLKLSNKKQYTGALELVKKLTENKKALSPLLLEIKRHNNQLIILTNDIDQPYEENEVKAEHNRLIEKTNAYFHDFEELKLNIFLIIIDIIKQDKQKRLLN